uniref:Uncharacterized protein n=1 Tax=Knipowitschia caucasica TaxID=637954 RepID=A0AAV2IYE8_KNICA
MQPHMAVAWSCNIQGEEEGWGVRKGGGGGGAKSQLPSYPASALKGWLQSATALPRSLMYGPERQRDVWARPRSHRGPLYYTRKTRSSFDLGGNYEAGVNDAGAVCVVL